jgi:glutaredoxin 3
MRKIEIYTSPLCGYCHSAKTLLNEKGLTFVEFDISSNADLSKEMLGRASGRHTVPQIFIGDIHVGGCDELMSMDRSGKLDRLLAQ